VPFMAAFAFQNQRVLSELVAQFLDLEFAGHGAIVAALGPARPSSIRRPPVLCKLESVSSSGALVRMRSREHGGRTLRTGLLHTSVRPRWHGTSPASPGQCRPCPTSLAGHRDTRHRPVEVLRRRRSVFFCERSADFASCHGKQLIVNDKITAGRQLYRRR
jgi:hypothetical protein